MRDVWVFVGYARTSTADQKAGLDAVGCNDVFKEQLSSVSKARTQLDVAIRYVRKGDTLLVTKLDRLARSLSNHSSAIRSTAIIKRAKRNSAQFRKVAKPPSFEFADPTQI